MKNLLLRWLLLSLFWTASAQADIRFERFIPTQPTSDSAPTAELWFSGSTGLFTCDTVGTVVSLVADSVVVNGSNVRLQIPVVRFPTSSGDFCFSTSFAPKTWRYPLTRLVAGSYTLEIIGRDINSPERPNFLIATVPFVVGAGTLVDVPLLTGWGTTLLVLTILVIVAFSIRKKAQLKTFCLLLFASSSQALPPPPVVIETITIEITLRAGVNRTTVDALVSNGLNGRLFTALSDPALSNLRLAQLKRPTGAYQSWLNARPNAPAAVLSRIAFADVQNRPRAEAIVSALRLNNDVQGAYILPKLKFSAGPAPSPNQDGQVAIRADLARRWQSGWALIGSADSGIQIDHPKLAAFDSVNTSTFRDAGTYQGGNFLWAYAGDEVFGGRNIDERRCVSTTAKGVSDCIPFTLTFPGARFWNQECPAGTVQATFAGHGTHIAGIAAASSRNLIPANSGLDFSGVCAGCSLAVRKATRLFCGERVFFPNEEYADPITSIPNLPILVSGIDYLLASGVQVLSLSFENTRRIPGSNALPVQICAPGNATFEGSFAMCSALVMARQRGVIVVAAAGNLADYLAFPASEPDVFPAMGFTPTAPVQYWQVGTAPLNPDFVGSSYGVEKPFFPPGGSNYLGYAELQAPAFEIRSTFYFGQVWNSKFGCESFNHELNSVHIYGVSNASYFGICTGTSMAAPALAGVAALVRSTNPLLVVGQSAFDDGIVPAVGVSDVMARSAHNGYVPGNVALAPSPAPPLLATIPAQQAWGFGIVDAEAALIKTMGAVAGQVVKHRLTPLFQLRSQSNNDFAYTTSPQSALALNEVSYFSANSTPVVQGFPSFVQSDTPIGDVLYAPPAPEGFGIVPSADLFILANDYRTSATQAEPDMPRNVADANNFRVEPLFWLSRCRSGGSVGCGLTNAEFLVALERELTQLNSIGYELRGRIGFVIACKTANCATGAPTLPSMERIYRAWKGTNLDQADAALIGSSMLNDSLYTDYSNQTAPSGIPIWPQVYAFKNLHSDGDQLIDGQEVLAGSNEMAADSDCDGLVDSVEYPVAGVPQSDPMLNFTGCADMRIAKTQSGSTTYRLSNPLGPNAAANVLVTIFYAGSTVSPPFSPSSPTVPAGWNCTQASTFGAQNTWQSTATCSKNGGSSFAIGELANFNVPKISGLAQPYQATVVSLNDPAAGNNLAN